MRSEDFTDNSFVYRLSFRPTGRRLACRLLVCVEWPLCVYMNNNSVALNTIVSPSVDDLKLLCAHASFCSWLMG